MQSPVASPLCLFLQRPHLFFSTMYFSPSALAGRCSAPEKCLSQQKVEDSMNSTEGHFLVLLRLRICLPTLILSMLEHLLSTVQTV